MSHLVFDTETSGLFNFKLPAHDPIQPHLASFAAIEIDDDGEILATKDFYVKPNGWKMEAGASAVNGLTDEFLHENGVPVSDVLDYYADAIERGLIAAAFNAQFDLKMMRGELRRLNRPDMFEKTRNICLMRPLTDICRIPNPSRGGYKWPKLEEALAFFGLSNNAAHTALGDAEGARLIYVQLKRLGALPAPDIHFAKERL